MSRHGKQFIYGTSFLVLFALVCTGFYFLFVKPAPTCFDKKQNQNEEGVDCGGVCAQFCLSPNLRDLEIAESPKVFYLGANEASLLVKIQNPNPDFAVRTFSYTFDLFDDNGVLLRTLSGNSFVYAGEIKYLFVPILNFSPVRVGQVRHSFTGVEWLPTARFPRPSIGITSQTTHIENNEIRVDGNLVNQDTLPFHKIEVLAIFYSDLGVAVGVSETDIDDVVPGETRVFTIRHPEVPHLNVNATQVFASVVP